MDGWHLFHNSEPHLIEIDNNVTMQEIVNNFTNTVAKIHQDLQSDGFFSWIVAEDDHNSTMHVIQLDQVCCTVWKFKNFSPTHILREINFEIFLGRPNVTNPRPLLTKELYSNRGSIKESSRENCKTFNY